MAIKPQYAKLIREGKKTVELRRIAPNVVPGDILVIYESAPISKVTSFAEIEELIKLTPEELWNSVGTAAMLDKASFNKYFSGKQICSGIRIKNVVALASPKPLNTLPCCAVPQNYRYLSELDFSLLCL